MLNPSGIILNSKNPEQVEVEVDGSDKIIYVGFSDPGVAYSAAKWLIFKLTYDVNDNLIRKSYADGSRNYNKEWDERATYSYVIPA
jgi:hypothetical protein